MTTPDRKTLWSNTLALTVSGTGVRLAGLVWTVYLGRTLAVEVYGQYVALIALTGILITVSDFGVGMIGVRETALKAGDAGRVLGSTAVLRSGLGLAAAVLLTAISLALGWGAIMPLVLLSALRILVAAPGSAPGVAYHGIERMGPAAAAELAVNLGGFVLGYAALSRGMGLEGVFWGFVIASAAGYGALWLAALCRFGRPRFSAAHGRRLLGLALPVGVHSFTVMAQNRVDRVLLSRMASLSAAGWFNAAGVFVIGLTEFLWTPYSAAVFPLLSRLGKEPGPGPGWLLKRSGAWFLGLTVPAAVGLWVWAGPLMTGLFGSEFQPAAPALRIMAPLLPLVALRSLWAKALLAAGREDLYMKLGLLGFGSTLALDFLLIPVWGVNGAAWAALGAGWVTAAAAGFWVRRHVAAPLEAWVLLRLALLWLGFAALAAAADRLFGSASTAALAAFLVYAPAALAAGVFRVSDIRKVIALR